MISKIMAQLCKISYIKKPDNSPDIEKIMVKLKEIDSNFNSVKPYDRNGSQAILIKHTYYNVVVFRGSDEEIDWKNNFDYNMVERLGKLHRGFWRATNAISNEIIYDLLNLDRPIYITGHSLGGAMATVFAHILNHRKIKFKCVYTYGQPRVFSFSTADKFNAQTKNRFYRYQNNNDAVCHVPPGFIGYKHVGKFRYIDSKGISRHSAPFGDKLRGLFIGLRQKGIDFQEDHDINDYIKAL